MEPWYWNLAYGKVASHQFGAVHNHPIWMHKHTLADLILWLLHPILVQSFLEPIKPVANCLLPQPIQILDYFQDKFFSIWTKPFTAWPQTQHWPQSYTWVSYKTHSKMDHKQSKSCMWPMKRLPNSMHSYIHMISATTSSIAVPQHTEPPWIRIVLQSLWHPTFLFVSLSFFV